MVQWLRLHFPVQGLWIRSLVGELRSHMSLSQKPHNMKHKQYCNKFNKDFKNDPHYKKNLKNVNEDIETLNNLQSHTAIQLVAQKLLFFPLTSFFLYCFLFVHILKKYI